MKRLNLIAATFLYIYGGFAGAQILIDESADSSAFSGSSSSSWLGSSTRADLHSFNSVEDLRGTKKVALSTTVLGATGLLGMNLNLNFVPDVTFSLGVGLSRGFQSFNLHVKQTLGGESLMPYLVGGYSRWASHDAGEVESTTPGILEKKFLSRRERETGDFAENILYPGFGLEYVNLTGDYQGLGFFAEILLLVDIDDLEAGAVAGLGSIFYF